MVKVKFSETRTVKDASHKTFEAGKTYEMSEASAEHWIKRGVAVEVGSEVLAHVERPEPKKPDVKLEPLPTHRDKPDAAKRSDFPKP